MYNLQYRGNTDINTKFVEIFFLECHILDIKLFFLFDI